MTSIWFPNNKYPPNTKNYLPCFVLGGGLVLGGRDYFLMRHHGSSDSLCQILLAVEQTGVWPSSIISGFTTLIPKSSETPETPTDLRPITVLSVCTEHGLAFVLVNSTPVGKNYLHTKVCGADEPRGVLNLCSLMLLWIWKLPPQPMLLDSVLTCPRLLIVCLVSFWVRFCLKCPCLVVFLDHICTC